MQETPSPAEVALRDLIWRVDHVRSLLRMMPGGLTEDLAVLLDTTAAQKALEQTARYPSGPSAERRQAG